MSFPKEGDSSVITASVAEMFDDMAGEYDNLNDLWYRHTFGFIDHILATRFAARSTSGSSLALDVGCGTGIQSFRLASLGYSVDGIDISRGLLDVARRKALDRKDSRCRFHHLDATALTFPDGRFEMVNCCGPTLSFIPDWPLALSEMARAMAPGARLLLEVEGKWNPDVLWEILSAALFDCLGYKEGFSAAFSHILPPWKTGHSINYAFKRESGDTVMMPLKTFTISELRSALGKVGISVTHQWGLHSVTNLIPSPFLHESKPLGAIRALFSLLAPMDRAVARFPFFRSFGSSLLVEGIKQN